MNSVTIAPAQGEPTLPETPFAEALLKLVVNTDWALCRKDAICLVSEDRIRQSQSLDFEIGNIEAADDKTHAVPFTFLRKAKSRQTAFDMVDEAGRSLPLPTVSENQESSWSVLVTAAKDAHATRVADGTPLPSELVNELVAIVTGDPGEANELIDSRGWIPRSDHRGRVKSAIVRAANWLKIRRDTQPYQDEFSNSRKAIMQDPAMKWMLPVFRDSLLTVVYLPDSGRTRRVVRLSFDEEIENLVRGRRPSRRSLIAKSPNWKLPFRVAIAIVLFVPQSLRWLHAAAAPYLYRMGLRQYQFNFVAPYVSARSYHLEFHSGDDPVIVSRTVLTADGDDGAEQRHFHEHKHVHHYIESAVDRRRAALAARIRVSNPYTSVGLFLAAAITTLAWVIQQHPMRYIETRNGGVVSVIMLIPTLAAAYLARPQHALVARLLDLCRGIIACVGTLMFLLALQLAVVSDDHPVKPSALDWHLKAIAIACTVLTSLLLLAWLGGNLAVGPSSGDDED